MNQDFINIVGQPNENNSLTQALSELSNAKNNTAEIAETIKSAIATAGIAVQQTPNKETLMSKQTDLNNHANQLNANKGTSGFNKAYTAAMNNRANQLNPNNSLYKGASNPKK